jgi:hypothetical protein
VIVYVVTPAAVEPLDKVIEALELEQIGVVTMVAEAVGTW